MGGVGGGRAPASVIPLPELPDLLPLPAGLPLPVTPLPPPCPPLPPDPTLPDPPPCVLPDEPAPERPPPPPSERSLVVWPRPVGFPFVPQAALPYPARIPTDNHKFRWLVMDSLRTGPAPVA